MALENTIRLPYLSHGLRDQSIGSSLEWSIGNSAKTVFLLNIKMLDLCFSV